MLGAATAYACMARLAPARASSGARCSVVAKGCSSSQHDVAYPALHRHAKAWSTELVNHCSRAFIRWALAEPSMPVPSPTYLLQNIYDDVEGATCATRQPLCSRATSARHGLHSCAGLPIHHMDLYRITAEEQLSRLQLGESWRTAVSLIEWPERLGDLLPAERLSITLQPVEVCLGQDSCNSMQRGQQAVGLSCGMTLRLSDAFSMTFLVLKWSRRACRQATVYSPGTQMRMLLRTCMQTGSNGTSSCSLLAAAGRQSSQFSKRLLPTAVTLVVR